MCIYLCWPILYTYLHLVTYSVHEEYSNLVAYSFLGELFFTFFMAYRFSYLCLPILYNYLLFILITHHFLHIFYKYHFMTYFVHMRFLWPILFICIPFYIFYGDMCAYLWLPICTLTSSWWPILCVLKFLTANFWLIIFTYFMATSARTSGDLLLLTFSLRTELFHGLLFCTHIFHV